MCSLRGARRVAHALSAMPRQVSPSRSFCEEGVASVISPEELVVVESGWDVWSASWSRRPGATSSDLRLG